MKINYKSILGVVWRVALICLFFVIQHIIFFEILFSFRFGFIILLLIEFSLLMSFLFCEGGVKQKFKKALKIFGVELLTLVPMFFYLIFLMTRSLSISFGSMWSHSVTAYVFVLCFLGIHVGLFQLWVFKNKKAPKVIIYSLGVVMVHTLILFIPAPYSQKEIIIGESGTKSDLYKSLVTASRSCVGFEIKKIEGGILWPSKNSKRCIGVRRGDAVCTSKSDYFLAKEQGADCKDHQDLVAELN